MYSQRLFCFLSKEFRPGEQKVLKNFQNCTFDPLAKNILKKNA